VPNDGPGDALERARRALAQARADAAARGVRPAAPGGTRADEQVMGIDPERLPRLRQSFDAGGSRGVAPPGAAQPERLPLVRGDSGPSESVVSPEGSVPSGGNTEPERLRGNPWLRGDFGLRRAARRRRDDPQRLNSAIDGLLADQGWRQRAAVGGAFGRWEQIVGADLAAHARPERFTDGELVVVADSTAWATQLRLLADQLVRRLNRELGDGTVRRVRVHGPSGESWSRRGGWRVRGERGPRDTYG
jgi:predicted nucleic acid-binding Zn ribbon protein